MVLREVSSGKEEVQSSGILGSRSCQPCQSKTFCLCADQGLSTQPQNAALRCTQLIAHLIKIRY